MTSIAQVENALNFLSTSAEDYANARGELAYLEEQKKIVRATIFGMLEGKVAEREAGSYSHPDYVKVIKEYQTAVIRVELLRAKRASAEARIEVWRSLESSRRAANIT